MSLCIDGTPHFYTVYNGTKVYCQKCLITANIIIPPDPPTPTDPRPISIFTPPAGDCTVALQNWLNVQPNNAIWDIRGLANINTAGLRISAKTNVKLTSSTGGGFKAIGNGAYSTPFSSLFYSEALTSCSFESLKFLSDGHPAMGLFLYRSTNCKILACESSGVAGGLSGAPWAGIYGERNSDTEVANCLVTALGNGIRGIWFGVGDRFDIRPHIHHNTVRDPGHTGIVVEASGPNVHNNSAYNVLRDGTAYKFLARGAVVDALFDDNLADGTAQAAFMIEGSGIYPKTYLRRFAARNCGKIGSTFGMLYVSNALGVQNVEVSDCALTNCQRIAAMQYATNITFKRNTTANTPALVDLELNCVNIVLDQSGDVTVGPNCSDVWVNGVKKA